MANDDPGHLSIIRVDPLRGTPTPPDPTMQIPDDVEVSKLATVHVLRAALEQAERGEIVDVILVYRTHDGEMATSWSRAIRYADRMAALEMAKLDWYGRTAGVPFRATSDEE